MASTSSRASGRASFEIWRVVLAGGAPGDVLVAHVTEQRQMRNVDQEVVELGHVLEAGADRGQCSLQIFEALRRLRREIARLAGALAVASYPSCPAIDCAPRTGHLD